MSPAKQLAADFAAESGRAHPRATQVTIVGRDGTRIGHPRKRFSQRSIDDSAGAGAHAPGGRPEALARLQADVVPAGLRDLEVHRRE
jgi:hypothetical protein